MELIVRHGEREEEVHLEEHDDGSYAVRVGEATYEVDVATAGRLMSLRMAKGENQGAQHEVAVRRLRGRGRSTYEVSSRQGAEQVEVLDPLTHMLEQTAGGDDGATTVTAYMPGRVVEVLVAEGDEVTKGQGVVVLEAMKMKNEIQAETDGTVVKIHVDEGRNVEGGDPLFEIG